MRLAFFALMAVAGAGCRKVNESPTCNERIAVVDDGFSAPEPLPYLPALPGSWWRYSDGSIKRAEATPQLYPVMSTSWDVNRGVVGCCVEKNLVLPIYDGYGLYRYTRMRPDASGANAACSEVLLSENINEVFFWGGDHYGRTKVKTIAVGQSVTLSDGSVYAPCVLMKRVEGIGSNYFDAWPSYTLEWYARGVGLVRTSKYRSPGDSTIVELVDYRIGS